MINYSLILNVNYANKQWILAGNSYEGLDWHDESPKPTQSELDALWESAQSAYIAAKEAAVLAKQSALSKLSALGLTDAEIKALTGTT